jgi:hypothetical protein
MAELTRFDGLRNKTEEQLIRIINKELDRGIRDARRALCSAAPATGEWYLRAERAYGEVSMLIPLAAEITHDERSRVESRLRDLSGMLEQALDHNRESDAVCLAT